MIDDKRLVELRGRVGWGNLKDADVTDLLSVLSDYKLFTSDPEYKQLRAELERLRGDEEEAYRLMMKELDARKKAEAELAALKANVSDQKKALDLCGYVIEPIRVERDALKEENERLKQQSDVRFYDCEFGDPRILKEDCLTPIARLILGLKARAEKAEADLAALKPLVEAIGGPGEGEIEWDGRYTTRVAGNILRAALAYRQKKGA